jgi:hypothetical protein
MRGVKEVKTGQNGNLLILDNWRCPVLVKGGTILIHLRYRIGLD